MARTEKFKSSFYPNCISEWNKLDPEIWLSTSVAVFKTKLLSLIRPPAKSVFGIHDPLGLSYLSQIRVGLLIAVHAFHKFKHNFKDTVNQCVQHTTALKIRSTLCCFALHLTSYDDIFSLEFQSYCDLLPKSKVFQIAL